ncbi:hypothetical protein GWN42_19355 [candidate division KSB1 bacterium]|nr:hypothetical protein [candidate division KSB1 bacterium]
MRFKQIKHPKDNLELQSLYKEIAESGVQGSEEGVPINLFTSQSERPDILQAGWAFFKGTLLQGQLPPTLKQMISMTIALQNNCRYCVVAHTFALEAMGVPKEVIESCASDPELSLVPPPQRAIIKFALKAARDPKSINDEDFQTLHNFGLSDGEIMEVIMVAACAIFTDFWADISGLPVDWEKN